MIVHNQIKSILWGNFIPNSVMVVLLHNLRLCARPNPEKGEPFFMLNIP